MPRWLGRATPAQQALAQDRVNVAEGQLRRPAGNTRADQVSQFAGKGSAGRVLLAGGRDVGGAVAGRRGERVDALDVRDVGQA